MSGQEEVWVKPFPNVNDGAWSISNGFGVSPRWGPEGNELFYQTTAGPGAPVTMMAVAVETEPTFRPGTRVELFAGPYRLGSADAYHAFDVGADGRFLMIREGVGAEPEAPPLIVIKNWVAELERLVPIN